MRLKGFQLILASFSVLFLFSCLTINIYFPEAAVKKTADEIVGEITKSDKEAKEEKKDKAIQDDGAREVVLFGQDSSFSFVPSAYAQQETEVSTPKIRALKQSLSERRPKLRPFFEKGNIGEAKDGFIQVRDESGLGLQEKAQLRNLVKDENDDRKNLYAEVAVALDVDPKQIDRVQKIFAETWIKQAQPGWWIQKESGEWVRK